MRVATRVTYGLEPQHAPTMIPMPPAGYTLRSLPAHRKVPAEVLALALAAGVGSRFNCDPSLTRAQYERMYRAWCKALVARRAAAEVFACYHVATGTVVGFISLAREHDAAVVGLLAVDAAHRRRGLASLLLKRAVLWAAENGAPLRIAVPSRVPGAQALLVRLGFSELTRSDDWHLWMPLTSQVRANVPYVTYREKINLKRMFRTKEIESIGPFTVEAQRRLAQTIGSPCVLLSGSATAALDHAAIVTGIGAGDEGWG